VREVTWRDIRRFTQVDVVTLEGNEFDAAELVHLQDLPRLNRLRLRVAASADLMGQLAKLQRLERLDLSGYRVGRQRMAPEACDPLESLVRLQTFSAAVTGMQDRHLVFLKNCPRLRRVYLWDLGVTGETLANLSEAPGLEELLFFNCRGFRDKDVEYLKQFKNLRSCWIHGGYINPDLLASVLDGLPSLRMDPARRAMYRAADTRLSHRSLWKLPDL
jgi:hypothetical protein